MAKVTIEMLATLLVKAITSDVGEPIRAKRMYQRFGKLANMRLAFYLSKLIPEEYREMCLEIGSQAANHRLRTMAPAVAISAQEKLNKVLADRIVAKVSNFGPLMRIHFIQVNEPLSEKVEKVVEVKQHYDLFRSAKYGGRC